MHATPPTPSLSDSQTHDQLRLRRFYHTLPSQRARVIEYRDCTLRAENPDSRCPTTYEICGPSGVLGVLELTDFEDADDIIEFLNIAIDHDYETALHWLRTSCNWGTVDIPATVTDGDRYDV